MKCLFVLACYFDKNNPVIFNAIKSIRNFHPKSDIVVIDSGSKDKSYFDFLQDNNVIIEDINNKHYDTGAYWYAFKKFKESYDFFYFLHDSIIIKESLDKFTNNDFTSIQYFYSHNLLHERYVVENIKSFLITYFKSKIGLLTLSADLYGFDTIEQKEWVELKLKDTKFIIPKYFNGLFGPMMLIHKSVMEKLLLNELDKILPSNKEEQKAMERIFGIVLSAQGIDITCNTLQGDHLKPSLLNNNYITKIILNRD